MTKTELIERIAQEAGVTTSEAQEHFGAFESVVTETLKDGEDRVHPRPVVRGERLSARAAPGGSGFRSRRFRLDEPVERVRRVGGY